MKKMQDCQFFITEWDFYQAEMNNNRPIDHFFYAPRFGVKSVVPLETCWRAQNWSVSVVDGEGQRMEFDDVPSALRRMADLIEAYEREG